MGLLDIGIGLAEKYGPALLQGIGNLNRGAVSGSPMYSSGFAAPASRGSLSTRFSGGRKKHRRGLTASDIRGAQKVARLVQHFGFKPKIKARRRRR
jgi:hypothetical protein